MGIWHGARTITQRLAHGGNNRVTSADGVEDTTMATTMNSSNGDDLLRRNRKYKFTWAVFLTSTALLAWDKITGDQWVTAVGMITAAYMAGNVGEHFAKRRTEDVGKNTIVDRG